MKRTLQVLAALGGASAMSAHAEIPANVTTALSNALTDATGVAAMALVIVVAIAAFKYMKSAVR